MQDGEVALIVALNAKGSFVNRKTFFVRGFGFWQALKMVLKFSLVKLFDGLDWLSGRRLLRNKNSIWAIADRYGIPIIDLDNPNCERFLTYLQSFTPDLVLSFSAPLRIQTTIVVHSPFGVH